MQSRKCREDTSAENRTRNQSERNVRSDVNRMVKHNLFLEWLENMDRLRYNTHSNVHIIYI